MDRIDQHHLIYKNLEKEIQCFMDEDLSGLDLHYFQKLPTNDVRCVLHIKSDVILSGLPYFWGCFQYFLKTNREENVQWDRWEGKFFSQGTEIEFPNIKLPFGVALTAERLALNLLERSTRISTTTNHVARLAKEKNIRILDTRKTTPGLRTLEKYAVRVGGGVNHRFSQFDALMIKDNHKHFFGGLSKALDFFESTKSFYTPIIVEIHSEEELLEAIELKISHVMLDNFSPEQIQKAVSLKPSFMTYEISGGINEENLESYLIEGVDAISMGFLTRNPDPVDLSFKYYPV